LPQIRAHLLGRALRPEPFQVIGLGPDATHDGREDRDEPEDMVGVQVRDEDAGDIGELEGRLMQTR
jgi:hypothetical protein